MLSFFHKSILTLVTGFTLALVLGMAASTAFAQSPPRVSLLTFQPGSVYWQRFGHNAILVKQNGKETVYNYGIFDFNQDNFMLNFAAGRMQYRLAAEPLRQALYPYHVEGRWALEQQLALTPEKATELADFLAWNAQPENAEYRYDYFIANCSTKVRDVLNEALSGHLQDQLEDQPGSLSYRDQVARVSAPDIALMLGMDIGLGTPADQSINLWEESFIPSVLMRAIRDVKRADGTPLVSSEQLLLKGRLPEEPAEPPQLWPLFLAIGLGLAALVLVLGKARRYLAARISLSVFAGAFTLVFGLGGLVLAALWGLTEHWGTYRNQNLLLVNPVYILLLPLWLTAVRRAWRPSGFARWLLRLIVAGATIAGLLHLVPGLAQDNLAWVALLLPLHLSLLWLVERAVASPQDTQTT